MWPEWLQDRLTGPGPVIRPCLLIPAEVFRDPPPTARLGQVPRRFPVPLAYRQGWTPTLIPCVTAQPVTGQHARARRAGDGCPKCGPAQPSRVFHFDVQGSVAKSTHSGLPWLLYLRRQLASNIHFWPFDGWEIPAGKSAIVEVYPTLWSRIHPRGPDLRPARRLLGSEWMRGAGLDGA